MNPLARRIKCQSVDVRQTEAQAKKAKHDSEYLQEREDRRQQDAKAKAVKCQYVDVRLKEAQAKKLSVIQSPSKRGTTEDNKMPKLRW